MRKSRAVILLTVTALLASCPLYSASSAEMRVSVQVIARTILTVDSQPASVEISSADVTRGYVDLPPSIAFHVRSNARSGYSLQFEPMAGPFTRADVNWGTNSASVGAETSWVAQPYQHGTTVGTMSVRLVLSPQASPGTYSWPVVLGANSL